MPESADNVDRRSALFNAAVKNRKILRLIIDFLPVRTLEVLHTALLEARAEAEKEKEKLDI